MTTPGLAAGPLPTLLPRNILLLITKITKIIRITKITKITRITKITKIITSSKVAKQITDNVRYRRGASLVRVGPILLALGGRRRARSYNSVEVHTPSYIHPEIRIVRVATGNTLMVMVAMMTGAIYQA